MQLLQPDTGTLQSDLAGYGGIEHPHGPADGRQVRLVLMAPPDARISPDFQDVQCKPSWHDELMGRMQQFRGSVYLEDGAVERRQLSRDGRHRVAIDADSWHLLALDGTGNMCGCVRYYSHASGTRFQELWVRHSALATSKIWGGAFRQAVDAELQQARQRNVSYVEVGGWAISSERRCTTEAARTALATYSLARILGGCIGITTATVRHSSSSLLRRLGGSSLRTEAGELPPYYDPQYTCEMEVLRFDSESPAAKYFTLVDRLRSDILSVPVVCRTSPRAPWSYHCYPNRRPPAAQFSTGLYAAQRA